MKMKKVLAGAVASVMAVSSLAAFASAATTTEEGTAYIMLSTGVPGFEWWDDGTDRAGLDATTAKITGNGQYTVSLKVDGEFEDDNEDLYETAPSVMFAALGVNNGEVLFPGMIITIDKIEFDGKAVDLKGTPYTSSDDGKVTRVNLRNPWVTNVPDDARTANGTKEAGTIESDATWAPLFGTDGGDVETFEWTEMAITFTVSGIQEDNNAEGSDTETTDKPAGDTNKPTDDKNNADTGIEGVAIVAGLAVIAGGAVVVAKKRK